eukprot:3451867-Rhodomonas_salina.1
MATMMSADSDAIIIVTRPSRVLVTRRSTDQATGSRGRVQFRAQGHAAEYSAEHRVTRRGPGHGTAQVTGHSSGQGTVQGTGSRTWGRCRRSRRWSWL